MSAALVVVTIVLSVALTVAIVALAVPLWSESTYDIVQTVTVTTHVYSGLWTTCSWLEVKDQSSLDCSLYGSSNTNYDSSVKASQAMLVIGGVAGAAAFIVMILKCCFFKENTTVTKIIGVICIGAAVFLLIGTIVWATAVKGDLGFSASDLNVGFAFCVIASVLFIIVGVALFIVKD